jgi:ribokinase
MRQTRWDLVVVGGAYTDYVVQGRHLPTKGETAVGTTFLKLPGSKASNQAVEAARLGARVALVARVGADQRGDEIIEKLKDEGIDTSYIMQDEAHETGMSLIHVDMQGKKQMMVALGASASLKVEDVQRAREVIAEAKVVSTQLEISQEAAKMVLQLGREAGACTLFDPAPAASVTSALFSLVDVIKPDAKEAQTLTGIAVEDQDSAREAARYLLQRGVRIVAIQAGALGNLLIWREGEKWLPRIAVPAVDTTGAGDAFAAALAVALAEGQSLEKAGPFASAAAALTTTKLGARPSLPHREKVLKLLHTLPLN